MDTSWIIVGKSDWFLPKPLTISPNKRKKTGMEEPWMMAPRLPKAISIQSYLSAKQKRLWKGRLCSFFLSASGNAGLVASGTLLLSAIVCK